MVCAFLCILEITSVRLRSCIEPIIGNSNAQSGNTVTESDIKLFCIGPVDYSGATPECQVKTGCTYAKFADNTAKADSQHAAFGEKVQNGVFDVEDLAMGFIRFDNGACLQLEFSWASNIEKEKRFVELRGTKAGFTWNEDGTVGIWTEDEHGTLTDLKPYTGEMGSGHARALEHFTAILLDGAKPDYTPQQGVNMIRILDALYESARTGKEVRL